MAMIHIADNKTTSELTKIQENDIQPNAVDLRLGKVFRILPEEFVIDEKSKKHRGVHRVLVSEDGMYHLHPGSYEVIMENEIKVGSGEAGWVITRSSLNRNGVFLTSGLYDSGYEGVMAGVMHVNQGMMKIAPGTRIGQYLSFEAKTLKMYEGSYGSGSEHDKKYS